MKDQRRSGMRVMQVKRAVSTMSCKLEIIEGGCELKRDGDYAVFFFLCFYLDVQL